MPHTDEYDKHEELHALDDGNTQKRGFLPEAITFLAPLILGFCIILSLYLFLK